MVAVLRGRFSIRDGRVGKIPLPGAAFTDQLKVKAVGVSEEVPEGQIWGETVPCLRGDDSLRACRLQQITVQAAPAGKAVPMASKDCFRIFSTPWVKRT